MQQAILSWFPSRAYASCYAIVVLAALLSDEFIPRMMGAKGMSFRRDRGSFLVIYLASLAGFAAGLFLRYSNVGVVPFWVQVLALVLLLLGTVLREWAIAVLGSAFSRTVRVDKDQRLVTSGPFRWIRHPAYTGMLIMDTAIVLGLGTWIGALVMFAILLLAALYRIRVEERALLAAFGEEYRAYMQTTAPLFPLWRP